MKSFKWHLKKVTGDEKQHEELSTILTHIKVCLGRKVARMKKVMETSILT